MRVMVEVGSKLVQVGTCLDFLPRKKPGDTIVTLETRAGVVEVRRWYCAALPPRNTEVVVRIGPDCPHPADLPGWRPIA